MMMFGDISMAWASAGSTIASLMFIWAIVDRFMSPTLKSYLSRYAAKITAFFNPYVHITIPEYTGQFSQRNDAYTAVEAYLTVTSSGQAKKLNAEILKPTQKLSLTIDTYQEVVDTYQGFKVWWYASKTVKTNTMSFSWYPDREERRYYQLTFHGRSRSLVTEEYLPHVISQGKAIEAKNRKKKLFTNNSSGGSDSSGRLWSSVAFDHPATFDTLAMDPERKKEVMDDLTAFRERKEYYRRIGRAWKRGYLLFGPPGTGKSSMVAAMANFLDYDVYDLELTAVKDNTELRKLLFDTASRSVIVIEDIDCSLDLAGKRVNAAAGGKHPTDDELESYDNIVPAMKEKEKKGSRVTLSGLLNFIDGLWSACGEERIIVFTTNYVEKLDPALIRRGRMDMHVELSFCSFQGFKVLAKNYLGVESHPLFETIGKLLEEVGITPADVAESLMPKGGDVDATDRLQNLVDALVRIKEGQGSVGSDSVKEYILSHEENEAAANIESEEGMMT